VGRVPDQPDGLIAALGQEALQQQRDLPVAARNHYSHAATLLTSRPPKTPAKGAGGHTGSMGRKIGTILGAILAIWLAVTAAGGIFATFKAFLIIGLIAMVVFIIVWLVAGRQRRD
jgi:predicted lipid-binding transport protein (Tim44 family)